MSETRWPQSADGFARVEEELKRDPARSDKSIATITGMSKASVYRTRVKMEFSGEIPVVPPNQRIAMNGKKMVNVRPGLEGGPRIEVQEGESLLDIVYDGRDAAHKSSL